MPRKKEYASYSAKVKATIAATGRTDLFPELKIPRATAEYWVKKRFTVDDPLLESLVESINESRDSQETLKAQVSEAQATLVLLKNVFLILGYKLRWKHIESREKREKILTEISHALKHAKLDKCLEVLDLSISRYKRWKSEKKGCGLPDLKVCPRGALKQLTFQEIQKMRELVTSKDYAHFPIRSLHYFAKKENLLFCSYSTWKKYIHLFKWKRARKNKEKKCNRIGIRAKHPNEIWHLDVSHFPLPNGEKCYIQAIIDNYSRYVLAWQVMTSYDGAKTGSLLEEALKNSARIKSEGSHLELIVDGGGENKSHEVQELEEQGHFKKLVAKFEISFSNSMVAALFRSLKNNYLYDQDILTYKALLKHTSFWFKEYNERIPHTAFKGETPLEKFTKTWSKSDRLRILVRHEEAIKLRLKNNQEVFCKVCKAS